MSYGMRKSYPGRDHRERPNATLAMIDTMRTAAGYSLMSIPQIVTRVSIFIGRSVLCHSVVGKFRV